MPSPIFMLEILPIKLVYPMKPQPDRIAAPDLIPGDDTFVLPPGPGRVPGDIRMMIEMSRSTIRAQDKEKSAVGLMIQDQISQKLVTAKFYLETAMAFSGSDGEMIRRSQALLTETIRELQQITRAMLPPPYNGLTLVEQLEEYLNDIRKSVGKIELNISQLEENLLADDLKSSVFRIIQEHLSRLLMHHNPTEVMVELSQRPQALRLLIEDNSASAQGRTPCLEESLAQIIARAGLFRGTTTLDAREGKGYLLIVSFALA